MLTGITPEKHPPSLPYRPPAVYAKKTGPLEGTFAYGKQGGIEYKPNWGQPIGPQGEWLGQPTQSEQFDTGKFLQQNLETLKANFKDQAERLRNSGLSPEVHNKILAGMQAEYDKTKAEVVGIQSQVDFIKQSVSSGSVDPTAANEAMARLVLPTGVADTMFPQVKAGPQPSLTGTTPSRFGALSDRFAGLMEGIKVNPPGKWWLAKNIVDKKQLKKLYESERRIANLNDPRNIGQIAGFNQAFSDAASSVNGGTEALDKLLQEDADMQRWFAPPSRLGNIVNQKLDGKSVSPLAKSVLPKSNTTASFDLSEMSDGQLRKLAGIE